MHDNIFFTLRPIFKGPYGQMVLALCAQFFIQNVGRERGFRETKDYICAATVQNQSFSKNKSS